MWKYTIAMLEEYLRKNSDHPYINSFMTYKDETGVVHVPVQADLSVWHLTNGEWINIPF